MSRYKRFTTSAPITNRGERETGAIVKRVTTLVSNNRFGWGISEFERVFTKMIKETPAGKIVKEGIDEVEEEGEELIEQSLKKILSEEEFIEVFGQLNSHSIPNTEFILNELCCKSPWKFVGAQMVLRVVRERDLLTKIAAFESRANQINGLRIIDILLNSGKRIEVKSWIRMYRGYVVKQFIRKDLANINTLDDFEWLFDAKYPSNPGLKIDFINAISTGSARTALRELGVDKIRSFFPESTLQINEDNFVDFFISKLNQDDIFWKIFKLYYPDTECW